MTVIVAPSAGASTLAPTARRFTRKATDIPLRQIASVLTTGVTMPTRVDISRANKHLMRGCAEPILLLRIPSCYVPFESAYATLSAALQLGHETIKAVIFNRDSSWETLP